MQLIKTLIVDDSAFVRKVIREILSSSPYIEVVGIAKNGEDALAMAETLKPDVITCDLNMPELGGVEFVKRQMATRPVPIIILTASPQDTAQVVEALEAGAFDFVQKPSALATDALRAVREELIEKVKAAAKVTSGAPPVTPAVPVAVAAASVARNFDIVVLGISTGGPQALRYMLPQFSKDFPVPLVIVLHMPTGYTAPFAEKLAEISQLPVKEAFTGCPVVPGQAWLAPAGRHLTFQRDSAGVVKVRLAHQPAGKPHKPSVDVMFESAAKTYGKRVLGVVMTGMGSDGTEGAAWIKAEGGMILTESEQSCIIYGMPRCVVEAGLSDGAIPLASMTVEINKRL
ncbi:MAG TPA: chemotaxis-specific protein-glutamate methyltransferase CheB [Candidatus Sulfotelmatobacter sp.]|nr:chemotaxis-specific protein-glutamate methyltransferase CheB [Candidatus Sulfotelmatobacter sp.]